MPTPATAFGALRRAGLKVDDPDIVKMLDIDRPDFIEHAKATKPGLFRFDARSAPAEEVAARLLDLDRDARRRRAASHTAATMAALAGGR